MESFLIKDTTKEEREKIVAQSLGNIGAACDGCMAGLAEMYQEYIDGKKELKDINMKFMQDISKAAICPKETAAQCKCSKQ